MKFKWKVFSTAFGAEKEYTVGRQLKPGVLHSGNIEFADCGYMNDRAKAQAIADRMNREVSE